MSKVIKARVKTGRYQNEIVRISNISTDEMGRQNAACTLTNGTRANIRVSDLEVLEEKPEVEKQVARPSMPFVSGSSSSRTLTHTKNMAKNRVEIKTTPHPSTRLNIKKCESCGEDYNQEHRKGMPGKLTQCENCAQEVESKMEGTMIFSHKTGATIEIKKDGELIHEAETFNYKDSDKK